MMGSGRRGHPEARAVVRDHASVLPSGRRAHGVAAMGALLFGVLHAGPSADAQTFVPIRPPSAPLVTKGPYVSTWQANGQAIGTASAFWTGNALPITGLAEIDGRPFLFFGTPDAVPLANAMTQTMLETTPTRSVFRLVGGGITLGLEFLSSVEPGDFRRQSIPLSDITVTARSSDGAQHTVSIYLDIGGAWSGAEPTGEATWTSEHIVSGGSPVSAWSIGPQTPNPLAVEASYPRWGHALWATGSDARLTMAAGEAIAVRDRFIETGTLDGAGSAGPPLVLSRSPVFAFARSLGTVGPVGTAPVTFLLGQVRDPAVEFLGRPVRSLWTRYFASPEAMLAFAYDDHEAARTRAAALDARITARATAIGGARYAALTALSLRQAFAATELIDTPNEPSALLEEISSDNDVSSVDVVYPSMPAYLSLDPEYLRALLNPLLIYGESGRFPERYAVHDLGTYPLANGHDDGLDETMPVEASSGMILMADAYLRAVPADEARAFARAHYRILEQWAEFLLTRPSATVRDCPFTPRAANLAPVLAPAALDAQLELTTQDSLGCIPHPVRLSLKGVLAIGAMSQIAALVGDADDARRYAAGAVAGTAIWAVAGQNGPRSHLLREFREPETALAPSTLSEPDSAYDLKFDMFTDRLLGLDLVPQFVRAEEADFYRSLETPDGIVGQSVDMPAPEPFGPTPTTNVYSEMWAATGTGDADLQRQVIDEIYHYADTTAAARPLPDLYGPTGDFTAFEARPVVGGLFAPFLIDLDNP